MTGKLASLSPSLRPREKLISRGPEVLSISDLLAILLGTGVKGRDVLSVARDLSKLKFPSISFSELRQQLGIGKARACLILAAVELGRRLFEHEENTTVFINGPESVYRLVRNLASYKKEHFIALYLNTKNRILKQETVSVGSLFANLVHPREVFAPALEIRAAATILIHNHPSGDPEPSPEDLQLTRRLREASQILGIEILDHLIIAGDGYVSFQERGIL